MQINTAARQLLFSTVRVQAFRAGQPVWTGTSFFFDASRSPNFAMPLLISNRHVFMGPSDEVQADMLRLTFVRSSGDLPPQPVLGQSVMFDLVGRGPMLFSHPDPDVDLAGIAMSEVLQQLETSGNRPFHRSLHTDQLPSAEVLQDLDAIEEVTFVGYPNGIFDTANLTPIMRRGTTATPIQYNYGGGPRFVIDAAVFPGSSGSPVLILDEGSYRSQGNLVVGSRLLLLGVVAAVHLSETTGELVPTALPGVAVDVPNGLGIVYRWDAVEEMIDVWAASVGLDRDH